MSEKSARNVIRLAGVPEGGVTDDGDFAYIVLRDTNGQETFLAISHISIPQMITSLESVNQKVRAERKAKNKPASWAEANAQFSSAPQIMLDAQAGLTILSFPHADTRPTRVALKLEDVAALALGLTEAIQTMADPKLPKKN